VFTKRDADCLDALLMLMGGTPHPGGLSCPNRVLADELGLSISATVYRLFRLEKIGVISLDYTYSSKNGKLQQRVIKILTIPPRPWESTNGDRAEQSAD
jgi:DNA-binding Lrp family transcriptional regulator